MYLVLLNDDFRRKLFCKNPSRFLINSPIKYALQTHTLTLTKKQALLLFLVLHLPSSSLNEELGRCNTRNFRPWVPDLNLNKSLEPMSETPCKYFLHSKSSFNSLYTLNLLFLDIPECKLLLKN